jgi:predicted transcriptional regulator
LRAVKIVQDPEAIKLLSDLVRREILRLIAVEPLTQKQLAKRMEISEPSMSHHLQLLLKAGLIRIKETKIGPHGILEKYYEPTAKLFIEDWDKIPSDLKRYFVHSHMERLRGMISVFQLIAEEHGQSIEVTSKEIKELAQEIAKRIPSVAKKYEDIETNEDRETLLIKIYSETLKCQMNEDEWKGFFSKIKNLCS